MNLVERFVEQHSWPDSRKTAWLAGLGLPFQILATVGLVLPLRGTGFLDLRAITILNLCGSGILLASWLIALAAHRAGMDGRWTTYLFVGPFGVYLSCIMHGLGTWSTTFVYWIPLAVFLCAIWYDATCAMFVLALHMSMLVAWTFAEQLDAVAYAPLVVDRAFENQGTTSWAVANAISFTSAMAICAGLGVIAARTRDAQETRLQGAFAMIRRYVPGQVAEALLANPDAAAEAHERRRLTIFFSDLVGFTDLSDELEPEDLSRLLNEYFSEMTAIAHEYGGTIDELSGDAILVFFGAPDATTDRDHAVRAVKMARDMQLRLEQLNQRWAAGGRVDRLEARIGINTGVVTVGNFGSPERMKYAALGRHVNAAARLQASCPPGGILLTHSTWLLVRDEIPCSPNGELTLKGLHKPVETYLVDTLR